MQVGEPHKLETPASPDELYYARPPEVADFGNRPTFTGDVMQLPDGRLVCAVQHPCAMRTGPKRNPVVLVCSVSPFRDVVPGNWDGGHYRRMFLPDMKDQGAHAVEFVEMMLVTPEEIDSAERVVILSAYGVNLLLQRWTYHNNRVVIPTMTINAQSAGPFEEADLVGEAYDELVAAGDPIARAGVKLERWLSDRSQGGPSQRDRLGDAQSRSTVRRELRTQVDQWVHELQATQAEGLAGSPSATREDPPARA